MSRIVVVKIHADRGVHDPNVIQIRIGHVRDLDGCAGSRQPAGVTPVPVSDRTCPPVRLLSKMPLVAPPVTLTLWKFAPAAAIVESVTDRPTPVVVRSCSCQNGERASPSP